MNLENIIDKIQHGEKEYEKMITFTDGSFRIFRKNSNLLQYRFMLNNYQKTVYGYTKKECFEKRMKLTQEYNKNPYQQIEKSQYLEKWLNTWYEKYKKPLLKESSLYSIQLYMKKYIIPALGKKRIKGIKSNDLQDFLTSIDKDNTREKIKAVLTDSFNKALQLRYITENPMQAVEIRKAKKTTLGALTHIEQKKLLEIIDNQTTKDIVFVLLCTGLRQGELLALTKNDIDTTNKNIIITKNWSRITNNATTPKTIAGYRTIAIEDEVIKILAKYFDNERIFGSLLTNDNLQRILSTEIKKVNNRFSGHILRHTFITNAYEMSFSPWIVKNLAGHEKIDQASTYLALRNAGDFCDTDITKYMQKLKERYTIKM